ncbi:formate dehydrogenase accessory sulfurtransferase FdhD [Solimonas marina]|uniref:Sulfur carrier protein FdhD n=1 Tax=Solimonas marina TaxID=2714601 RepID=A0A969WAC6_9GAMM|nr:formate dehydrogenase accessory sulfurtransferase FdhD [Solimonas marina]NKF23597.1 formate dehydrogenase accessory sulfurtransferase FdhD [Solimonas marina]
MSRTPLQDVAAERRHGTEHRTSVETVAEETPIALVYNGRPYAVMMATPADLDDFAVGFSLSEGIVTRADEIEVVDRLHTAHGISLQMLIPQRHYAAVDSRHRNLTGRTGCGLCGTDSLQNAIRPVRRVSISAQLDMATLLAGMSALEAAQPLNDQCGATHAAAFIHGQGQLLVREDVGRHNAIDKLVGAAARRGVRGDAMLVTSRASYEVVHKAAQADCPIVAAISAPTALAIRIANEAGITLAGFTRETRLTLYAGTLAETLETGAGITG